MPRSKRMAAVLATVSIFAAPMAAFGVADPSPASASLPAGCSQSTPGGTVVCSYSYTGAEQTFAVPTGVASFTITATGASGGGIVNSNGGGLGGTAQVTVTLPAGTTTLYVEVGGQGADNPTGGVAGAAGGFNGGGAGGAAYDLASEMNLGGSGGGGASDVRTVSNFAPSGSLSSRLVVGGGGGGGCSNSSGGPAGQAGGAAYNGTQGGGGGTATGGGAGGNGSGSGSGQNGTLGQGGAGAGALEPDDGGCDGGAATTAAAAVRQRRRVEAGPPMPRQAPPRLPARAETGR